MTPLRVRLLIGWFGFVAALLPVQASTEQACTFLGTTFTIYEAGPFHRDPSLRHQEIEIAGQRIPVPLGIAPVPFGEMLTALKSLGKGIDGIMVFGSRTHFTDGYLPTAGSDFDYKVFYRSSADRSALESQVKSIMHTFRNTAQVSVESNLKWDFPFTDILTKTRALTIMPSFAAELAIYKVAQERLMRGGMVGSRLFEKEYVKDAFHKEYPEADTFVGREALLILRQEYMEHPITRQLREAGYRNISSM